MSTDYWDALEVSLAESVVADRVVARDAVVRACQLYPLAPVPHLILAFSSMAATLEENWFSGSLTEQQQLLEIYRTMVALSADLAALDLQNTSLKTCADLLTFWKDNKDPFFAIKGL